MAKSGRNIDNVSDTARWVARYRAIESGRPDAIFKDPFAERLAGEKGKAIVAHSPRQTRNGWPVVARTKAIDDMVLASLADGCDCVVNLAAGLDTRPYRLPLPPSLRWIEADLPAMIDEKARLLANETPSCELVPAKVDLSDASERASFLTTAIDGRQRVLVISEGLLMYLNEDTVRSLARDLDRPAVAWWVFDTISPLVREGVMKAMPDDLSNAPMLFSPPNGVAFFEALGWKTLEARSALHDARRLRRLPTLAVIHSRQISFSLNRGCWLSRAVLLQAILRRPARPVRRNCLAQRVALSHGTASCPQKSHRYPAQM